MTDFLEPAIEATLGKIYIVSTDHGIQLAYLPANCDARRRDI